MITSQNYIRECLLISDPSGAAKIEVTKTPLASFLNRFKDNPEAAEASKIAMENLKKREVKKTAPKLENGQTPGMLDVQMGFGQLPGVNPLSMQQQQQQQQPQGNMNQYGNNQMAGLQNQMGQMNLQNQMNHQNQMNIQGLPGMNQQNQGLPGMGQMNQQQNLGLPGMNQMNQGLPGMGQQNAKLAITSSDQQIDNGQRNGFSAHQMPQQFLQQQQQGMGVSNYLQPQQQQMYQGN